MKPQFPYKCKYTITQGYAENAGGIYPDGHHGALDIVPQDENGFHYPAEIYPVFDGAEVSIQDTSPTYGEGIRVRTKVDSEVEKDFTDYLKGQNVLPKDYTGIYYIDDLYWHILKALDKDGTATQDTPIALTGNTGDVYTSGHPVPNDQKGVPPYPGLHLHWAVSILDSNLNKLNLDKDSQGRIDPMIIVNYKGEEVQKFLINLNGKIGTLVCEGFTFGGGFAKDEKSLEALKEVFEFDGTEKTINLN